MGAGLGRLLGPGLGCSVGFIVGVGVGCLVGAFVGSKVGGTNTGVGYAVNFPGEKYPFGG